MLSGQSSPLRPLPLIILFNTLYVLLLVYFALRMNIVNYITGRGGHGNLLSRVKRESFNGFISPRAGFPRYDGQRDEGNEDWDLEDNFDPSDRHSRSLSPFKILKFGNLECEGSTGDNGTCYLQEECYKRRGSVAGKCARGYGVCCIFSKTCGTSTQQNTTYFTHNGQPNNNAVEGSGTCQLTIYKTARNVCQLRLDFVSFNIAQPGSDGLCHNDQFIVTGSMSAVPIICGLNSGNHMYLDVGVGPVTLSVVSTGVTYTRSWKIKITQIRCNDVGRASECLQYFTGVSGVIRSYNFDFANGQQLSNQDYSICIRAERNFCGIQYMPCSENNVLPSESNRSRAFSISGGTPRPVGAVVGEGCSSDWITIPCATNSGKPTQLNSRVCQDRLCGDAFNSINATESGVVYSYVKPFRIYYHTDSNETVNEIGNRGLCLTYVQQPCGVS